MVQVHNPMPTFYLAAHSNWSNYTELVPRKSLSIVGTQFRIGKLKPGQYTIRTSTNSSFSAANWAGALNMITTAVQNLNKSGLERNAGSDYATFSFRLYGLKPDGTTGWQNIGVSKRIATALVAQSIPVAAGQAMGPAVTGRWFGSPLAPRDYGIYTPDGRRLGN